MINARLNKASYTIGDTIRILLDFSSNDQLLQDVANINIDIFRVERNRNNFVFGFGHSPETSGGTITISKKLPETFTEGLYLVSGIRLIQGETQDGTATPAPINDITRLFFWFSKDNKYEFSESELTDKINKLDFERGEYNNAPTITDTAKYIPTVVRADETAHSSIK